MTGPSDTALAFEPDPNLRYKLVYLARRNPALAVEEFPAAWRAHSQLAASFGSTFGKHFVSSQQCVRDPVSALRPSFTQDYDGSSILTMKSWADLLAARYHPRSLDELKKDEARVFAGPVDDWTMAVEEHPIVDGEPTGHVLLSFIAPREECPADVFCEYSRNYAGELAERPAGPARLVWNKVVDAAPAYPFAAVVEAWFPDRDTALSAARDAQVARALEQADIADPARGARVFARINLARGTPESASA